MRYLTFRFRSFVPITKNKEMVKLTHKLIRKKSEHNEGTMADLEEISLHQLEIEKIERDINDCKKLKILYL